ncbi:MAG: hypothetical protein HYY36_06355 [Gammaproteobacteria bacterium]|nr:hypothetical protein [Gammaproteobacteria bacterium]
MRYLNRASILLLLAALILGGVPAAAIAGPPKLPPPPKSSVGLLGKDMVFNGIPMEVRQFQTPLSVAEVVRFYTEYWPKGSAREPGYVITEVMKPWKIITRADDGYLMTVQVRSGASGATGFLAMSKLPDPDVEPQLGDGFPVLHGTHALNDVRTRDIGKDGRTLTFINDRTAEANAQYYRSWFQARGWTLDMDKAPGSAAYVLAFRNGDKSVNIIINGRSGRTYIVAQTTNL